MNVETRKIPEHQAIYRRISEAILFGELAPGQAVTIQGLSEMIGSGVMPVRDAIRRLTADGALKALGNRRIEVPRMTLSEIDELSYARSAIEPKLAKMALIAPDSQLADELKQIDLNVDAAIATGSIEGYLTHNYEFHFHLYHHAGADILTAIAHSLWLRSGPSLRVVCGRFGTANLPDMHDEAMAAIRDGDAERLGEAIRVDIGQGMDQVRRSLMESDAAQAD